MTKRDPSQPFTSLRIIGKKAQTLFAKAKQSAREPKKSVPLLPEAPEYDEVLVHLSIRSVVKSAFAILAILAGVLLTYFLQDKIILLLLALFVAAVLEPGVQMQGRMGIPRGLAVLAQYFIALFLLLFLLISLIPIISVQLQQIALFISQEVDLFLSDPTIALPLFTEEVNARLTSLIQNTLQDLSIDRFTDALQQFGQNLSTAAQGSLRFAAQIAGSVVNFFLNLIIVLVLAFFIQLEKEKIIGWLRGFIPVRYRPYLDTKSEAIHIKIAQWARGQLLLSFSIACLVFLALVILRMPYALTLAILAGFTEFIPVVGPFIAAVPAVMIALTQEGFIWALVLALVYYIIQWCENNLLVPLIMKRAVGLSPVAIMFAMLVGISFPGVIHPVLGIILSIPTTTIIALFLEDWRESRARA
ncbi:MAG: AI-2E family transporter [Patescibacteria group bacterium]